ncbi:MAG: NADH-quinone oxidoreductase subunit NuoB [Coriobacteriales bacterium]|jgi:ech hydrogenase subunit C|nr:NADH-quinone oxidoreductase subunit NuoB [Coriobacteriales bacterium]
MSYSSKSPWVIHYDASSCNGCDIEVLASLTPLFDVERFGIINTGNPKHADVFLVTGSVNERNITTLQQIYEQMLEPKVVIACGICACTGGVFKECYNTLGGVDVAIPVDVYAPGCAIRPEAIIDAVVRGLGVLEQKRQALAAGELKPILLPEGVSAADKLLNGTSLRSQAQQATLDAIAGVSQTPAGTSVQAARGKKIAKGASARTAQTTESTENASASTEDKE